MNGKTGYRYAALVLILLVATVLRFVNLAALGLEHDEVANWLIGRDILAGQHAIYFTKAYGHEAGFHYVQSLFIWLIGDHALALRLPAALLGILCVAVTYRLNRALFNRQIGLIAALLLAITFFPVFYSRLALRAIMLPVLSGASLYFFWRGLTSNRKFQYPFIFSGLFAGLSVHTYMASRAVPVFYFLYFTYLKWVDRPLLHKIKVTLFLSVALFALIALPLFLYLYMNPESEPRIDEINAPLNALYNGNFMPVLTNLWRIVGAFGWSGDPLWRQNVAGMPIFNPLTAILFYGGVLLAIWRHQKADVLILLWLAISMIPSLLTVDAPSTIRMINMLPVMMTFPAIVIHKLSTISPVNRELSTGNFKKVWIIFLTIASIWGIWRTAYFTQYVWPSADEVPFVWQTALTSAGRYLDKTSPVPTTILGWSPDTWPGDVPTMELAMRRDDVPLRFAGSAEGARSLIMPHSADLIRIVRPTTPLYPLHPALENQILSDWNATETQHDHFLTYTFTPTVTNLAGDRTTFGDELTFLGYETAVEEAQTTILTYWRVERVPEGRPPRALSMHVLSADGARLAQSDGLDAPVSSWQEGDLIVHAHQIDTPSSPSDVEIRVGVYLPQAPSYPALLTADGQSYLVITVY